MYRSSVKGKTSRHIERATSRSNTATQLTSVFSFSSRYVSCALVLGPSSVVHVSQAIVVCMAGEYDDAVSRVKDLIASLHLNSICYIVQARARRVTAVNMITDASSRHICIFSTESRSRRVASSSVRYNRSSLRNDLSSVHEHNCDVTRAKHSLWSQW